MTGPEHYREAERLIEGLTADNGSVYIEDGNEQIIALAQVHATLALASASAESGGLASVGTLGVLSPWGRALSGEGPKP